MQIDILETTINDQHIFRHLVELYLYDFSVFMGWDVGDDGRFGDDDLKGCWVETWRYPFLVRVDTKLAGFAIVDQKNHLTSDPPVWDMGEFFILGKYRHQGIGTTVATRLFTQFPGSWEVHQLAQNISATKFWRMVIDQFTHGQFCEEMGRRGPIQFFRSIPE